MRCLTKSRILLAAAACTCLATGCSTVIRTHAQPGDTYAQWRPRLDGLPYVIHYPDGRRVVTDHNGQPWPGSAPGQLASAGRVEVFMSGAPASRTTDPCTSSPTRTGKPTDDAGRGITAALCDGARTVVTLSTTPATSRLDAPGPYLARVDAWLLKGLGGLDEGEPDPFME